MPLFELYRMTKEKLDSAKEKKNPTTTSTELSLEPVNDHLAELVMENGQILMQGQSSRTRKTPTFNNFQSHCLPSHTAKTRDKYVGNGTNIKMGRFGTMDSMLNEIPMSVPSGGMGLNQDDDMVPWLNYPIDESLQSEYCSEFLPELSGVTANELSSQNNFTSFGKRSSGNQFNRGFSSVHNDHLSLEQGSSSKISSVGGGEAAKHKSSMYLSSLQNSQTSFPYHRSRISDINGNTMKNSTHHSVFGDSTPTSAGNFPGLKMQKQDPKMPSNNSGLMNFSHFSRPAALVKANLQNIGLMMPGSNFSRTEKMGTKDKGSVASNNNCVDSPLIDLSSGLRKETSSHCQPVVVPSKADVKPLESKRSEELSASKLPRDICDEDAFKNDKNANQIPDESTNKGMPDGEKTIEPVVASSVCSGNSVERASDDPTHNLKRKHQDTEDSEYPSEDVEEESVGAKKAVHARVGSGSKRSRAAEVHNLSERRRRDRINEKMRSLQELIPNCNKVDKASMLDEAIEYLKTLQLQVQIMSMGAGLYMPPMMFPSGMQRMHAAHMAHFPPMGIGMGMGIGFGMGMPDMNGGSSGCHMVPVPQMHGAHFPSPPVSGPTALHGMAGSNFQLFGIPGQGLPISMPHAPLVPLSGGPIMKSSSLGLNACSMDMVGPVETLDSSATGLTSKDPMQNINSQVIKNAGANSSTNQTSIKSQATSESLAQPAALQDNCQASEATGACTRNSPNENDKVPNRADYEL